MKKNIEIIICMLVLGAVPTYARVNEEYMQWARGEFEIPIEIQEVNSVSELQPFIKGKYAFTRTAAVRRLGEIEGQEAVNLLCEIFADEPATKGLDSRPLVKLEVIRTLGRIGGKDAKTALLGMLKDYWEKGPNVENKVYYYHDSDFGPVVSLALEMLYKWSDDNDVFQTAQKIAFSEDVKKFYYHPKAIGKSAWKVYLKGDMIIKRFPDKEGALHLLQFRRDMLKNGLVTGSLQAAKVRATYDILEDYNDVILNSVSEALEEDLDSKIKRKHLKEAALLKGDIYTIKEILKKRKITDTTHRR